MTFDTKQVDNVDFLSIRTLFFYLLKFALILLSGLFLGEIAVLIIVGLIFFSLVKNNLFQTIEIWFLWFFSSNFFIGQSFISSGFIIDYFGKPSFLLFLITLRFFNVNTLRLIKLKFNTFFIFFLALSLFSQIFHNQSPFAVITIGLFYFIYLIFYVKDLSIKQYKDLLNLFVSVAILQTIISYLQITQIIPATSMVMGDGAGGSFEWVAGLDDAASGTFGPGMSHIASWYAAMIGLLLLLFWIISRKVKYAFIAVFSLLQFVTVDSKTILGVTVIMMVCLMYNLYKYSRQFEIKNSKLIGIFSTSLMGGIVFLSLISLYYEYQSKQGGVTTRTDVSAVYDNEVKESRNLLIENIGDWGKIKGFNSIYSDFLDDDIIQVFIGYGLQGYNYNGKMSFIESMDIPLMKLNNLTNSRSALITQFAQSGILGFLILLISLYYWYKFNMYREPKSRLELAINCFLKIFLIFTFISAFVYSISFISIVFVSFSAIIAVLKRFSFANSLINSPIKIINNSN